MRARAGDGHAQRRPKTTEVAQPAGGGEHRCCEQLTHRRRRAGSRARSASPGPSALAVKVPPCAVTRSRAAATAASRCRPLRALAPHLELDRVVEIAQLHLGRLALRPAERLEGVLDHPIAPPARRPLGSGRRSAVHAQLHRRAAGARPLEQTLQLGERRPRRGVVLVASQHAQQLAHLVQRLAPLALDVRERLPRALRCRAPASLPPSRASSTIARSRSRGGDVEIRRQPASARRRPRAAAVSSRVRSSCRDCARRAPSAIRRRERASASRRPRRRRRAAG